MLNVVDLYGEQIVQRARKPLFAGVTENSTGTAQGSNPMCGDRVKLSLRATDAGIAEIRHQTRGCAICMASADLMAQTVAGQSSAKALELAARFSNMLEDGSTEEEARESAVLPPALEVFLPLKSHRSRVRCATLPWTALGEALTQ
ncbi:Fe-S cluster assembly sulfur transfer protein SufU [Acetobacter estunensis]|uniref:Fe-S cluster assembly sulfur transfer protein SufU n=1 Tax=Acetobacter estunensis TaxID=104097 RepID=UPI001C2D0065|nr:SUF system NifU family Fe-S cluster assembly protein [Acetobacter estunensis]MBV1836523.1 SUF system NifU family Fe-S cluster assembly protein [Acetobacter estunensis]